MPQQTANIAILGCGYVADFYMATLSAHSDLTLVGVYDADAARLAAFASHHKVKAYEAYDQMLNDQTVDIVLNLTNPRAHFETTKAALDAGKNVYSEKPLAMTSDKARDLVKLAADKGLYLSTAPCSLLSETAQTLWKGVKDGLVGKVRLVYASFDDGMIHRMSPEKWSGVSGGPWPAKDEFEVGCTYEHAAYVLSWLAAIFGPAKRVQSYASVRVADKGVAVDAMAPDFTIGMVEYADDIIARITCSIVAPIDKSIIIIGEKGILYTKYVRNDASPVYFKKTPPDRIAAGVALRASAIKQRIEQMLRLPFSISGLSFERKIPFARRPEFIAAGQGKPVDFLRGPSEMAAAIREGRACRLPPELGLHMIEIVETLQYPERFEPSRALTTSFPPIAPLPWD